MPRRRPQLRATTANRYEWMIDNYINPRDRRHPVALSARRTPRPPLQRAAHHGAAPAAELASKTVYDVHVMMRSALAVAPAHLVAANVAHAAHAAARPTQRAMRTRNVDRQPAPPVLPTPPTAPLPSTAPRRHDRDATWRGRRAPLGRLERKPIGSRSPAAAKSSADTSRCRSRPAPADAPSTSTRPPKRSSHAGSAGNDATVTRRPSMTRCSRTPGWPINPESISQLFDRNVARSGLPRIRFHDLRHTHASCSSLPAHRSRSSRNGSATPTPASPWTPTNTSCPAWAPPPRSSSPTSSPRRVTQPSRCRAPHDDGGR